MQGSSEVQTLNRIMSSDPSDQVSSLSYAQINTFFECKDGVSIGFITLVVLGILTMWYILFTKITMGRRKRRDVIPSNESYFQSILEYIRIVATTGMSCYYTNN